MKEFLSERGKSWSRDLPALQFAHYNIQDKLYDAVKNPDGYINMGTAETHLINDEVIALLEKLQSNLKLTSHSIHYDYFNGSEDFRTAIAEYWGNIIFKDSKRKLTKENIGIAAGCTVALEMLATMLGDPGDVFLVPAPYYSSFEDDIRERAGVEPVPVPMSVDLATEPLVKELENQKAKGKRVRAVLMSSPNNPVGTVYSKEALQNIISFCMENDLDIISDEIYAQTIHDPEAVWVSMLSLVPDEYIHRTHVTSSFAKDFALSGLRTGFVISHNVDLLKGLPGLGYYSAVSTHTQALLTALLKCDEVQDLIHVNQTQLRMAYELIIHSFNELGIKTMPAQGGIFIMAYLGDYMNKLDFSEEYVLWEKIYNELKINISPGQLFKTSEPGWFRICYAHPPKVVAEACKRIKTLHKTH